MVVPREDAAEVELRTARFQQELAGDGSAATALLARRIAILAVRLDRSARHEFAATAERVRQAEADFQAARAAEAERLFAALAQDPSQRPELLALPEGVDLLLSSLGRLRLVAASAQIDAWTAAEDQELLRCLGNPAPSTGSRTELIAAEIRRLEAHREDLDGAAVEQARTEVADRALVGDDSATLRARKYEAATERGLFRALKEIRVFHQQAPTQVVDLQAEHARNLATTQAAVNRLASSAGPGLVSPVTSRLGSFFPGPLPDFEPNSPAHFTVGKAHSIDRSPASDRKRRPRLA